MKGCKTNLGITLSISIPIHHINEKNRINIENKINAFIRDLYPYKVHIESSLSFVADDKFKSVSNVIIFLLIEMERVYSKLGYPLWKINYLFENLIPQAYVYLGKNCTSSSLKQIMYKLLQECDDKEFANPAMTFRTLKIIDENFDKVDLNFLANELNVSKNYISQVISQNTGSSFTQLLHTRRIIRAMQLLKDMSLTLESISDSLGYNSVHYFCRVFKKVARVTPGQVREFINIYSIRENTESS